MTTHAAGPGQRRVEDLLAVAREICVPRLQESVGSLPGPLARMAGYHFGWCDADGAPARSDAGKALRPALSLAAAAACGGEPSRAVHAATSIELLHNFSLVHDDVLDRDRTRRGRPTVWSVWGTASAILLGDSLHALAGHVLAVGLAEPVARAAIGQLESATIEMCHGQYEDCAFETSPQVGVDAYVRMAMGKTGALMGCACALGALSAGADAATVASMDQFGRELGLAFQFADDLIGIWGDPAVTGKPVGNDLQRRKRTLPVAIALQSDSPAATELAQAYLSTGPMTAGEVARVTGLIEVAGGRTTTQQMAEKQVAAAIAALPDRSVATELIVLADMTARRDR